MDVNRETDADIDTGTNQNVCKYIDIDIHVLLHMLYMYRYM